MLFRMNLSRRQELFPFVLLALLASNSEATELRLKFTDDSGQGVTISNAELLLVAWGITDRIELSPDHKELIVPLNESWLRAQWPERFADMERAFIFIQADGFAPIRSHPFLWLGSHGPPRASENTKLEIEFPQGRKVVIRDGDSAELEIELRRPEKRYLRIIDDDQNPLPGMKVSSYMFWSSSNHCGHLSGADPLGTTVTGSDGRTEIPDGEFEYAFVFEKPLYVLKNPERFPYMRPRLVTYLAEQETIIEMHRWRRRPLEIHVTTGDQPVQGQVLIGRLAGCPCGVCTGVVGLAIGEKRRIDSDHEGVLRLADFYPEKWESVFFQDTEGNTIWKADPNEWPSHGTITVDLSKRAR